MGSLAQSALGGPFGSSGAPGFVPPAATAAIGPAAATSAGAMAARYNQLGLGGTPEAMDLGIAPSTAGGIAGQFGAIPGQLQNQVPPGLGKNTSPATIIGNLGTLFPGSGH